MGLSLLRVNISLRLCRTVTYLLVSYILSKPIFINDPAKKDVLVKNLKTQV